VRAGILAALLALGACSPAGGPSPAQAPADGWHEFEGSWTASGSRRTISLGGERRASVVALTGSLLLAGPSRPGIGFRAEIVGMGDTGTGFAGRAVWTDEKGHQLYSELKGEGTAARVQGRATGLKGKVRVGAVKP
jgi:hypothetical protein